MDTIRYNLTGIYHPVKIIPTLCLPMYRSNNSLTLRHNSAQRLGSRYFAWTYTGTTTTRLKALVQDTLLGSVSGTTQRFTTTRLKALVQDTLFGSVSGTTQRFATTRLKALVQDTFLGSVSGTTRRFATTRLKALSHFRKLDKV